MSSRFDKRSQNEMRYVLCVRYTIQAKCTPCNKTPEVCLSSPRTHRIPEHMMMTMDGMVGMRWVAMDGWNGWEFVYASHISCLCAYDHRARTPSLCVQPSKNQPQKKIHKTKTSLLREPQCVRNCTTIYQHLFARRARACARYARDNFARQFLWSQSPPRFPFRGPKRALSLSVGHKFLYAWRSSTSPQHNGRPFAGARSSKSACRSNNLRHTNKHTGVMFDVPGVVVVVGVVVECSRRKRTRVVSLSHLGLVVSAYLGMCARCFRGAKRAVWRVAAAALGR